jgi:hypothetical protein
MRFSAAWCAPLLVTVAAVCAPAQVPFTEDQLLHVVSSIKLIGEEQIIEMVQKRGVDFRLTESIRRALRKAGAGPSLLEAVAKASEERLRRDKPAATSTAAAAPEEVPLPPPLSVTETGEFIERARHRALNYTKELPSFICLQVTKRHVDPTGKGDWLTQDVIQARLAYDKQRENYQVVTVNNQLTDRSMESLGGATSTGEFGSLLLSLFEPDSEARFQWVRQGTLRGRAVEVFDFEVRQEKSRWHITYNKTDTVIPGYRGRVWIDRATAQTLRLSMAAVSIPPDFPIRLADTVLDYDYTAISGIIFLLPAKASVQMAESRLATRNEIEFRLYRKFTTETSISFDTAEDEKDKKPPPKKP